jgi:hypothetical protein
LDQNYTIYLSITHLSCLKIILYMKVCPLYNIKTIPNAAAKIQPPIYT